MPISKVLPDGKVEVYNTNTGEVKQVTVDELRKVSPNLVPQYQKFIETQSIVGAGESVPTDAVTRQVMAQQIVSGNREVKLSADEQKKLDAKTNAERIIKQAEDLYWQKPNDTSDDLSYGRLKGPLQSLGANILGSNTNLKTYEAFLSSIRPTLARAAGDVGNLSETEQLAATKIMPKASSTRAEAIQAFKEIRRKFGIDTPIKNTQSTSKFKIESIE